MISEETDLLEPTLLDELICHISTLASVYHRPPSSFVAGKSGGRRATLLSSSNNDLDEISEVEQVPTLSQVASQPITQSVSQPSSLLDDLLDMEPPAPPVPTQQRPAGMPTQIKPTTDPSKPCIENYVSFNKNESYIVLV